MIRETFMEVTKNTLSKCEKLNIVDMACGIGLSTIIISNSLDIPQNSQDIVFISYLLHELPFNDNMRFK